ncbi:hypothetical protein GCM10010168_93300 [Actinoplanes ianthinogenes]|uniref:Uncharacterized protein n=1 Tax=Actinoplanes ianthinogenes TaxID=122358 RepID=A0ABM7LKI6_9ACTN|nr:hypothetical protein Aiant_04540 [Actinoplanes ianthinogenes]GGR59859.1 hypothetical protein GCM10010168_93300 [Actinoplanes ianthinogenes]
MSAEGTSDRDLASLGLAVTRWGLVTVFVWVGALKFQDRFRPGGITTRVLLTSSPRDEVSAARRFLGWPQPSSEGEP